MLKMSQEIISVENVNLTTEQKKNYLTQTLNYWLPNQAFKNHDEYAMECGFSSFNDLLNADEDKLTAEFNNCLEHDLDPRYNDGLTIEQINSWLV